MTEELLKIKPANLPVYVYDLEADIALVHRDGVYKLKHYTFTYVRAVANQPLKIGDSLYCNSYYPGNSNTQIIQHLNKQMVLGGVEAELRYYVGCIINKMVIEYSPENLSYGRSGIGTCTVFIEMSACKTHDKFRELDDFGTVDEISKTHYKAWEAAQKEYMEADNIEWWKARIKDFDQRLELIGQQGDFLLCY